MGRHGNEHTDSGWVGGEFPLHLRLWLEALRAGYVANPLDPKLARHAHMTYADVLSYLRQLDLHAAVQAENVAHEQQAREGEGYLTNLKVRPPEPPYLN